MFKKFFMPLWLVLAVLLLFALPAPEAAKAAQKIVTLQDFDGVWRLDAEKSRTFIKEAVSKLAELEGFKFTVNSKAGTVRMEWPGVALKANKITGTRLEGKNLACDLDGHKSAMLLEKVSDDEILVKDRDEALVFIRMK